MVMLSSTEKNSTLQRDRNISRCMHHPHNIVAHIVADHQFKINNVLWCGLLTCGFVDVAAEKDSAEEEHFGANSEWILVQFGSSSQDISSLQHILSLGIVSFLSVSLLCTDSVQFEIDPIIISWSQLKSLQFPKVSS